VLLLGALLRLMGLQDNPPGLQCDEAANAYDAYSLLRTGRDMYGRRLPLLINHFNLDHLESLFVYAAVPVTALVGPGATAVRLTAAIFGSLGLIAAFLLGRELLGARQGLVAVALLAVSPWHLHYSRIGWRQITAPLFLALGFALLHGASRRPRRLPLAAVILGLTANTYASLKLTTPLLLLAWLWCFPRRAGRLRIVAARKTALAALLFLAIHGGLVVLALLGGGGKRLEAVGIISSPQPARDFIENMGAYLGPRAWWGPGDPNPRHQVPGYGQTLRLLVPFVILGLVQGWRRRAPEIRFLTLWYVLGAVPGALTWEGAPHFSRAIGGLPSLELLAAAGLAEWANLLRRGLAPNKARAGLWATGLLIAAASARYVHAQLVLYPRETTAAWEYGLQEAVERARELGHGKRYISTRVNQAYIYALLLEPRDPAEFQRTGELGEIDLFDPSSGGSCSRRYGGLLIARPEDCPADTPLDLVLDPRGRVAWKIIRGRGTGASRDGGESAPVPRGASSSAADTSSSGPGVRSPGGVTSFQYAGGEVAARRFAPRPSARSFQGSGEAAVPQLTDEQVLFRRMAGRGFDITATGDYTNPIREQVKTS
jgi:hypothetical protein